MRSLFLSIALLLSITASASEFEEANTLYENGAYDSAAVLYQQLVDDGFESAELFYNLGNTYYKLGQLGPSKLYLERARKLLPEDPDINYNLDSLVTPSTLDKAEPVRRGGIGGALQSVVISKSRNFWSWSTLFLFGIGFVLLILYLFSSGIRLKRLSFYTGIAALCIGFLTLSFAFSHKSYLSSHTTAVVMSAQVEVKNEPSDNSGLAFELHEGTTVKVLDSNEKWHRIEVNNVQGWVLKEYLKLI